MRLPFLKRLLFFLTLIVSSFSLAQYVVPEKPKVLYPVYDQSGILSAEEKAKLNEKLIRFSDSTSTEIEVVIIPSTNGEDVNFVAWQFGEKWKIGQKDLDNGIVLLVATEDRTMSIQQGRNVEKYLTASVAGQIIDYIIAPNFKQGRWYDGIDRGTTALMETVQGKFKPLVKEKSDRPSFLTLLFVIGIAIFALSIIVGGGGGGPGGPYRDDDEDVILSRRGRRHYPGGFFPFPLPGGGGGFGGGLGGGGGFGGFGGGGSFGGGGASGGW